MDTWPASKYLDVLGLVFNGISAQEAEPLATVFGTS